MGILTNIDKIAKKIRSHGQIALTPKEQEQFQRWIKVDQMIRQGRPKPTIVGVLMETYGVCRATAYSDYTDAQSFLGSEAVNDRDYWTDIIKDMILSDIMAARRMGDTKAVAMHTRNLIDTLGIKAKDNKEFDPEMYKGNTYQLAITINDQNFNVDMDQLGHLPAAQLNTLIQALQSPKLTPAEYMKILNEPDETEDGTAEKVTE